MKQKQVILLLGFSVKHYLLLKILTLLSIFTNIAGHGFDVLTLVDTACEGQWPIFFIHNYHEDGDKLLVKSYDLRAQTAVNRFVEEIAIGTINCYFKLGFDWDKISCSPAQEFYLPEKEQWVPAYQLKVGDLLLTKDNKLVPLRSLEFVNESITIYLLEVADTHCFFVGKHAVLTHNIAIEMSIGFAVAFGQGAAAGATAGSFFGPVTVIGGLTVGGLVGLTVAVLRDRHKRTHYDYNFATNDFDKYLRSTHEDLLEYAEESNNKNEAVTQITEDFNLKHEKDIVEHEPYVHTYPIYTQDPKTNGCRLPRVERTPWNPTHPIETPQLPEPMTYPRLTPEKPFAYLTSVAPINNDIKQLIIFKNNNQRNSNNKPSSPPSVTLQPRPTPRQRMTTKEAAELAEKLGYRRTRNYPFDSHNQAVFTDGNLYITQDIDSHKGGVWKLYKGRKRLGTYNEDLTIEIGS